jgi:hypothetical protein
VCLAISSSRARGHFGEEARDRDREVALEPDVLVRAPFRLTLAPARARVLVSQALRLGLRDRGLLDEHPLALVALARAAEAHDDRRQPAVLSRPARQRRVSPRQENEMREIRARHAERTAIVHRQQVPVRASAPRTDPVLERRDDHEIR